MFGVTETLDCLPFSGGWAEQPEWIALALVTLKTERNRADEEERKAKLEEEEERRKHVR